MNIIPYAKPTIGSWFFIPTFAYVAYEDGEQAVAFIWLQLEIGVRWI